LGRDEKIIFTMRPRLSFFFRLSLCLWALWLTACAARAIDRLVIIEVDGQQLQRRTQVTTVRQALDEARISLNPLDRVNPDLNELLERSTRIVITRVREEVFTEQRVLPFARQILRDEALPDNEARTVQLGVNGRELVTYRVRYENGQAIERALSERHTLEIPRPEILVVGSKGLLKPATFKGAIFYLSNNNAWVMRDHSDEKRPLSFTGDLDGRVFAVSPDAKRLLYSRRASVGGAIGQFGQLNSLWVVDTRIIGEAPTALPIADALYAEWVGDNQIVYSTGERTTGAPGWKAHNDLWLFDLVTKNKTQLLAPIKDIVYAFWGMSFALAPDGQRLVYASADELGFISLATGKRAPLQKFPVYETNAGWVWTPDVRWSPDSRLVVATLHTPAPGTPNPERAHVFGVWAVSADGKFAAAVAPETGMFANPVWSKQNRIAYAQAQRAQQSDDSQYDVYVMDADGSDKTRIFPQQGERGLVHPQLVWSSDGTQLLIVQDGNLFIVAANGKGFTQLTADGGGSHPQWR
jgi:hypothetical protein